MGVFARAVDWELYAQPGHAANMETIGSRVGDRCLYRTAVRLTRRLRDWLHHLDQGERSKPLLSENAPPNRQLPPLG
jgi:hypothetical protein